MKTKTGKRTALLLLTVILLFAVTASFVFAEDGLTPDLDEAATNSGDANFIKYRDNYSLDTEKISFFKNPMSTTFDGAANGLFAMQKGLATVQIYLFQIALESNILDLLEEFINPFIDSMRNYIFEGFSLFFISICALVLLLKLAANRQTQAVSGLLQILLIVTLAFIFYNHPVDMMKAAGDLTEGVSDAVMEGPYNAINGESSDASMEGKVSALIWNLMVHKPWQTAEFGSIEKAREYEGDILKLKPESDERKELIEKLAKEEGLFSKSLTHQLERVFTLLVLGVMNLLIFLFLTAFCVLIVGYQFLILVYMLLGVFIFLLALIPYFSIELVKRWALRILSACGTKILLAFFLSLLLVFMDAMYKFTDTQGLLFTLFMIIVIIAMIYIKRKEIVGLFTGFRAGNMTVPAAYQTMNRALEIGRAHV
jgi:ABC-type multidrug transport system fused ATPase/permease subunit